MRALSACLALVAAIALPGVIVAATSSNSGGASFQTVTGSTFTGSAVAPAQTVPSSGSRIDPALVPAMAEISQAFASKGIALSLVSHGFDYSQFTQFGGTTGNCPVDI